MSDSPIQQIKERLDIVEVIGDYLKLQKAGANYKALCPFHSEKTPSFFVSPARQIWHCFGACSTGGDIFKFVMQIEGIEFREALSILAKRAGVTLKPTSPESKTEKERLYEICEWSCRFFEKQLKDSRAGKKAKEYLLKRGILEESIKKWRLGYSPNQWHALSNFLVGRGYTREEIAKAGLAVKKEETSSANHLSINYYDRFRGRIMFPICDLNSRVIGFGGRIFDKDEISKPETKISQEVNPLRSNLASLPKGRDANGQVHWSSNEVKYINTPKTLLYDKSQLLYGLDKARLAMREKDYCILVEGYIDAIMVSQAGFDNVVATCGTALSPSQLRVLKRYTENLFTAFDMDVAGEQAAKKGINLAREQGFNIKVISLAKGKDPADTVAADPKQWSEAVKKASSIMEFYFENAFSQFQKETPEGKKEIAKVLLPAIKQIPNKIEQAHWIAYLGKCLHISEENILEELKKIPPRAIYPRYPIKIADDINEIPASTQKRKSRLELLEEHLLSLILKTPSNLGLIKESDFQFFSSKTIKLIKHFQQKGITTSGLAPELIEFVNFLDFQAEISLGDIKDSQTETKECLKELRSLFIKNKLRQLSQEIKKAEQEKNTDYLKKLTEEFRKLTNQIEKEETG